MRTARGYTPDRRAGYRPWPLAMAAQFADNPRYGSAHQEQAQEPAEVQAEAAPQGPPDEGEEERGPQARPRPQQGAPSPSWSQEEVISGSRTRSAAGRGNTPASRTACSRSRAR